MSFALVPSKLLKGELIQLEIDNVVGEFQKIAAVGLIQGRSVLSLVGNTQMWRPILKKALNVLGSIEVKFYTISPVLSKVMKLSLVVDDSEAKYCVQALHSAFFESEYPIPVNSSTTAASSSVDKKEDDNNPEVPPPLDACQGRRNIDRNSVVEETELMTFPDNYPMPLDGDNVGNPTEFYYNNGYPAGLDAGVPGVQPQQQVLANEVEGGTEPLNVLYETKRIHQTMMGMKDIEHRIVFDGEDAVTVNGKNPAAGYLGVDNSGYSAGLDGGEHQVEDLIHKPMFVGVDDGGCSTGLDGGELQVEDYMIDIPTLVGVNDGGCSAGLDGRELQVEDYVIETPMLVGVNDGGCSAGLDGRELQVEDYLIDIPTFVGVDHGRCLAGLDGGICQVDDYLIDIPMTVGVDAGGDGHFDGGLEVEAEQQPAGTHWGSEERQ
ncbi:uncharacterized protein LOC119339827 [Triticum dicoccoides]|uniref:uncharacterized protein LOC119339827 n=1 Tax=Triticum dicoccoides TaxID=85692 RepID=UPI001890BB9E|nr:uncharacterized protein LOC119339827 [Triticum dicoccoides]